MPGTKKNWIPLAIGAAILLLLVGLRSCGDNDVASNSSALNGTDAGMVAPTGQAGTDLGVADTDGAFTVEGLRGYLQRTDAAGANGRTFGLDRVTCDTGSAQLDQQDMAVINEVAGVLKEFPNAAVTITGYADPAGDAAANKTLGAQRTTSVKQALAGS